MKPRTVSVQCQIAGLSGLRPVDIALLCCLERNCKLSSYVGVLTGKAVDGWTSGVWKDWIIHFESLSSPLSLSRFRLKSSSLLFSYLRHANPDRRTTKEVTVISRANSRLLEKLCRLLVHWQERKLMPDCLHPCEVSLTQRSEFSENASSPAIMRSCAGIGPDKLL